jgi:hypothetical protein
MFRVNFIEQRYRAESVTQEAVNLADRIESTRLYNTFEGVTKSFRTGRLEQELQMVQLSATRCSCIAILSVSLASFTAITLCVAFERVFIVVLVYFVIDSVRKLLDTPLYCKL